MIIIHDKKCAEYSFEGHPESPARVAESAERLMEGFSFAKAKHASKEQILSVHTKRLHDCVESGRFHDPDTPNLPEMYRYAMLSAGGAVGAASLAAKGKSAFTLMRPPGHHAGQDFLGGFCYFNNIAVAAACLLEQKLKVALLDFDCHHGNGTQDIFLGKAGILYASLHQMGIFPGTGMASEKNCLNYPLQANTAEKEYMQVLGKAAERIKKFKPDILGVSAGFDTYEFDPLCSLLLKKESYTKIGKAAKSIGVPIFCVLEGGYSEDLALCIENFLRGCDGC